MNIKKLNFNFDLRGFGNKIKKLPSFLDRRRRIVIITISICFAGHCFYEYYSYIYHPVWSEKKRQEYINTKEKDAIFNEKEFHAVIFEIEKRKVEFIDNPRKVEKDIFKIYR